MASEHKAENAASRLWPGILPLAVASLAAAVQVLDALGALDAPGCRLQSGCHAAASSAFGSLPFVGWPLSHVGVAWFGGLLAAWIAARGALAPAWKWLVRGGVAASLFYAGVLAGRGYACPYCITVHVAQVAFWIVLETSPPHARARSPWVPFGVTVAALAIVLGVLDARFAGAARESAERELDRSTTAVRESPGRDAAQGFTGRHRRGPADARVRLVVFTDYQCEDCHAFEERLEQVLANARDVAVSIRHFPMCTACNRYAADLHPNACWAARAAEAASIVGGDDGFWRMHAWLFARHGSFTEGDLNAGLATLGFDRNAFLSAMHANDTLARVTDDIELGLRHGLESTPMVFVNGVELRGTRAPQALERALDAARAAPTTTAVDQPLSARERALALWRTAPRETLPEDARPHVLGRADAPVKIVLFGDYQEPFTCEADITLRALALANPRVSYSFRCFPMNKACNPGLERDLHPRACLAALGAEAAGILQGEDGFWALHDWIITHRGTFDDGTLTTAAAELGMAQKEFWDALVKPESEFWLGEDVRAAKSLNLVQIPLIFVDGRRVAQWKLGDENILPALVAEATR